MLSVPPISWASSKKCFDKVTALGARIRLAVLQGMTSAVSCDFPVFSEDFKNEVLKGLFMPHKAIPSRFLFDASGGWFFDRICQLEEYYLTRSEYRILLAHREEIAKHIGAHAVVAEYGPGNGEKSALLLAALKSPCGYILIDGSAAMLLKATEVIARNFPGLLIQAVRADICQKMDLERVRVFSGLPKTAVFLGSTIGNLEPETARDFLARVAVDVGYGGGMLVGVDLLKDPLILERAYNDGLGVTSQFNLNLLTRINRELNANFEFENFCHHAPFNTALGRIEMQLVSRSSQNLQVAGYSVALEVGEPIYTENSYKYSVRSFQDLARQAGWSPEAVWTDSFAFFSLHFLRSTQLNKL